MIDETAVRDELLDMVHRTTPEPLTTINPTGDPGTYLLVYAGALALYRPIARHWPIYVGSAISLSERMGRHRRNLADVEDLDIGDFAVVTIPTCSHHLGVYLEALATTEFRPVWNQPFLSGFGSRFQGRARAHQRRAAWSVLHPGRRCSSGTPLYSRVELAELARQHIALTAPPLTSTLFTV